MWLGPEAISGGVGGRHRPQVGPQPDPAAGSVGLHLPAQVGQVAAQHLEFLGLAAAAVFQPEQRLLLAPLALFQLPDGLPTALAGFRNGMA